MEKFEFPMPSEAENKAGCLASYEFAAFSFMDNWPPELHALSIPSIAVPLDQSEIEALIDVQNEHAFNARCEALAKRLDDLMAWRGHFVRLNTRSPKDASYPSIPITCAGRQAVYWLSCSERTFDDLCMLYHAEKGAVIYLREWKYIPEEYELRCFIKEGKLIAITQYHAKAGSAELQQKEARDIVWQKVADLYRDKIAPILPQATFVLDVYPQGEEWRVLEINPYGLSNPILFGDYRTVEEGGFRISPAPPNDRG